MAVPNTPTVNNGTAKYHAWANTSHPGHRLQYVGDARVDPDTTGAGFSGVPGSRGGTLNVWYCATDHTILIDTTSGNSPIDDARDDAFVAP